MSMRHYYPFFSIEVLQRIAKKAIVTCIVLHFASTKDTRAAIATTFV